MNPVKESIRWLTEMGWTEKEAQNIAGALRGKTQEALWEAAPLWLEWAGEMKRSHECILQLAAMGLLTVELERKETGERGQNAPPHPPEGSDPRDRRGGGKQKKLP